MEESPIEDDDDDERATRTVSASSKSSGSPPLLQAKKKPSMRKPIVFAQNGMTGVDQPEKIVKKRNRQSKRESSISKKNRNSSVGRSDVGILSIMLSILIL
jgi:hypothetical protein